MHHNKALKLCGIWVLIGIFLQNIWATEDKIFIGGEIGLGGFGTFSAGAIGGYMHYFPKQYYIADKFRQGVRGIVEVSYTAMSYNGYLGNTYNYGGVFAMAGADYLLDFNPKDKIVWGVFGGLGIGYVNVFSREWYASASSFGLDARVGGSVTIKEMHRFELALGSGFSTLGLRYLVLF